MSDQCITVIELVSRQPVKVRVSKVAAFQTIREGGPTRVLFDAGGYVDVCGCAKQWALVARIIELGGEGPKASEENVA